MTYLTFGRPAHVPALGPKKIKAAPTKTVRLRKQPVATTLTRQMLYDMVWGRPMTTLAKETSLFDIALYKICRKHDVPTPLAVYRAKEAHGKPVAVTPLPPSKHAADILIHDGASAQETEFIAVACAATLLGNSASIDPEALELFLKSGV